MSERDVNHACPWCGYIQSKMAFPLAGPLIHLYMCESCGEPIDAIVIPHTTYSLSLHRHQSVNTYYTALLTTAPERNPPEFAAPSKAVHSIQQGDPPIDPATLNEPSPPKLPDETAHIWKNVESYHVTTSFDEEGLPNLTKVHVVQCMICGALWRHL